MTRAKLLALANEIERHPTARYVEYCLSCGWCMGVDPDYEKEVIFVVGKPKEACLTPTQRGDPASAIAAIRAMAEEVKG